MNHRGLLERWIYHVCLWLALSFFQANENDRVPPGRVIQDNTIPFKKIHFPNAANIAQTSGPLVPSKSVNWSGLLNFI